MPTIINLMFFSIAVVALLLITISLILRKRNKNIEKVNLEQFETIYQKKDSLIKAIDEADDAIEQLNSVSKGIFEEEEQKYQELLYLYQIIDEKKSELSEVLEKTASLIDLNSELNIKSNKTSNNLYITDRENMTEVEQFAINSFIIDNPKYDEIIKLYENGDSITDIAKHLNIGQGEVSLILRLKRRGDI